MGKVKAKTKSPSKGPEEAANEDSGFLSTVLDMGGQKDDVSLIGDVDDDDEDIVMNESDELDAEPIKRDDRFLRAILAQSARSPRNLVPSESEAEVQNFIMDVEIMEFIQQLKIRDHRDPSFKKADKVKKTKPIESEVPETDDSQHQSTSSETTTKKKTKGNKFKIQHEEISSSTITAGIEDESVCASADMKLSEYKSRKYLLMKTGSDWLEQSFTSDPTTFNPVNERTLNKLRQYAQRLYDDDVALYQERKKTGKSESEWMKTVVSSGTLGDKVAALTVMIQDAALHTIQQLDQLLAMLKKKGKRECFMALDNLKELFLTVWLPDSRKLRGFEEHPLSMLGELSSGNKDSRDRRLLVWYYEDLLKDKYSEFVEAFGGCIVRFPQSLAHDQLPAAKTKSITAVYELLVAKPEQEKRLLMVLVNKLGDPDHKVAAKCTHRLITLLEQHPNMKYVVTMEVERLLYRPNISQKAQYYAICFLNQMILSHEESELASRLISAYFSFFKSFVKKGEVDSRMMSALLSGVNRAYPYAKDDKAKLEENMNTLYQVVHIVNFNTSIQALMLIYQVMDSSTTVSDRYYTSLYRKMLDPNLAHSSKQAMFLNLLFKTLKKDNSANRVKAFVKRILQVSSFQSPTFACSTLILVAEVLKAHAGLLDLSQTAEDSDDEEHFEDEPEEEDESAAPSREKSSSNQSSSWVHRTNLSGNHDNQEHRYDPHSRNPLYTCADRECIWELKKMARHYHPTVVLFASNILEGKAVDYPGDPLQDFTLIRFLDRFVYRNPKKKDETKALQAKTERAPVGARAIRVDTEQYLTQGEAKIPVDEKFFFRYFAKRAKAKAPSKSPDSDSEAESETGSVEDDEFDDYLSKHEGQFEGDEKIAFDFAGEFTKTGKKSKKDDDDDSESSDSDDDLSDEEVDIGDLDLDDEDDDGEELDEDEMGGMDFDELEDDDDDDDDDDDTDGDDEDDGDSDDEDDIFKHGKKTKAKPAVGMIAGVRRGKKDDVSSLFASAEEFSHLLEEGAGSKLDTGGSQAMSNVKDKASAKQLTWELQRDRWLRDADWRSKKKPRSSSRGRNQPRQKGRKQKR